MAGNHREVITLLSAGGHVLCTSPSGTKVFGYLHDELSGKRVIDLVHPDDRARCHRALAAVLIRPPDPRHVEVRVRRQDGEWSWFGATIFNLLYEPCIGAIVVTGRATGKVTGKVSALEAAGEERQRPGDQAGASGKLEDFAYAVASDLKEPLRAISQFTELLVLNAAVNTETMEQAQLVADGVKRLSALFQGLNDFAVRGAESPAPRLDLDQVLAGVLQDLRQTLRTADAIVTVDPLPMVRGNEEHLARVLQNLICNSIEYRSEAQPRIHVSAERRGPDWMIKVRDNGIGIAREHHEEVFSLFGRLHGPETPGCGIGLAICRKIIESSGGRIWVESEPRTGSLFCFTVAPATGTKEHSPVPANAAGERTMLRGVRALSARKNTVPTEIRRGAPGR